MILYGERQAPTTPAESITFSHVVRALFELTAASIAPNWCHKRWTR